MPTKRTLRAKIRRAAELRAEGASWESIGKQLHRSAGRVSSWPMEHPHEWQRAFEKAQKKLLSEATAESIHTLRRQLRSDDEKSGREAAGKLMQFRNALARMKLPNKGRKASAAAIRIATHVEALSDEQLHELLDRFLPAVAAGRQCPPPPPGPDGGG